MTKFKLIFLSGPREDQTLTSKVGEKITIGRDKSSTIVFEGPENKSVSRKHAFIEHTLDKTSLSAENADELTITDHSTNGTYVNGKKILNDAFWLSDGDVLSFSKNREDIKIEVQPDDNIKRCQNAHVYDSMEYGECPYCPVKELDSGLHNTSPTYTKLMPTANPGFLKEVVEQPFFIPAICTVFAAVFLFWAFENSSFFVYTNGLGIYLALMMLFFIRSISGMNVPFWLLGGTSLVSILLFYIYVPWILLELIFRPQAIIMFMDSRVFLERFIGHFVAAGLMEELFKAIPVFAFIALKNRFAQMNFSGIGAGKISPVLIMLIGASSAVGFIFDETMSEYVPKAAEQGEVFGLAILIPRFISGIAGHVGLSGIFSYYIGLAFYYKKFNPQLLFIGWVLASGLHGLWNASSNEIISTIVAIVTFTIFMIYLMKAKQSFPT